MTLRQHNLNPYEGSIGSLLQASLSRILRISDCNSTLILQVTILIKTSRTTMIVRRFMLKTFIEFNDSLVDEHARALEEQWIDSFDGGASSSLSQTSSQASSTILSGIVIGFFFPLIPLFFFSSPKPAVFWSDGREHEVMGSVIFS